MEQAMKTFHSTLLNKITSIESVQTGVETPVVYGSITKSSSDYANVEVSLLRWAKQQTTVETSLSLLQIYVSDKGVATLYRTVPFCFEQKSNDGNRVYTTPVHLLLPVNPGFTESKKDVGSRTNMYIKNKSALVVDMFMQSNASHLSVSGTLSQAYIPMNDDAIHAMSNKGKSYYELLNENTLKIWNQMVKASDPDEFDSEDERKERFEQLIETYNTMLKEAVAKNIIVKSTVIYPHKARPVVQLSLRNTKASIPWLNASVYTSLCDPQCNGYGTFSTLGMILCQPKNDYGNLEMGLRTTYARGEERNASAIDEAVEQTLTRTAVVDTMNGQQLEIAVRIQDRKGQNGKVIKRTTTFNDLPEDSVLSVVNTSLEFRRVTSGSNQIVAVIGTDSDQSLSYIVLNNSVAPTTMSFDIDSDDDSTFALDLDELDGNTSGSEFDNPVDDLFEGSNSDNQLESDL